MIKTNEETLRFLGLKLGDIISIEGQLGQYEVTTKHGFITFDAANAAARYHTFGVTDIIGVEYTILRRFYVSNKAHYVLKDLSNKFSWIARDNNTQDNDIYLYSDRPLDDSVKRAGTLYLYSGCPVRGENNWMISEFSYCDEFEDTEHLFDFITWEDEPFEIAQLIEQSFG